VLGNQTSLFRTYRFAFTQVRHLLIATMLVLCAVLTGCATSTPEVTSQRAASFNPSRGGTVCFMNTGYNRIDLPSAHDADLERIVKPVLEKHGFRMKATHLGANYALWVMGDIKTLESTSATVIGNSVHMDPSLYLHQMTVRMYLLKSSGKPEQEVWKGTANWTGRLGDPLDTQQVLLQSVMQKFPN
jgi:hypothetical protein